MSWKLDPVIDTCTTLAAVSASLTNRLTDPTGAWTPGPVILDTIGQFGPIGTIYAFYTRVVSP
jgi:hypothetical protein